MFDNIEYFVPVMLHWTAPTMLICVGRYLKGHEVNLADVFPFNFLLVQEVQSVVGKEKLMCQIKHLYDTTQHCLWISLSYKTLFWFATSFCVEVYHIQLDW